MGSPEVDQDYIGPELTWNLTGSGPKVDPEVDRKWSRITLEILHMLHCPRKEREWIGRQELNQN